jgi:hypothetical protein
MTPLGNLRKSILKSFDESKKPHQQLEVVKRCYRLGFTDIAFRLCIELCEEGKLENKYIWESVYHQN